MKISCRRMTKTRRADAQGLLNAFLREDEHYLETSGAYGDAGVPALKRALELFLRRSDLGFVWLAYADNEPAIRLYTSHGFEVEGRHVKAGFTDGQYHDLLSMARLRF